MTRRVGVIGQGAIARALVPLLVQDGHAVTVLARPGRGGAAVQRGWDVVESLPDLMKRRPFAVIEAAGQAALAQHGAPVLRSGVALIAASVGALADDALLGTLEQAAQAGGAQLHLPSGAIGGIDALAALARAGPVTLRYTGTKPPAAWPDGVPSGRFFAGTAREAALSFPKNANVAAILALAGPGLDATRVDLVSDATATGNTHAWEARAAGGEMAMTLRNAPSDGNASTSALTVHSLHRTLHNLIAATVV
ncbi:MAG: aspartate dehydrogenase [Rhodobacteraceae bacterium]|nr:aspartate dehydrogenase [Paracoccaceae bacterium]